MLLHTLSLALLALQPQLPETPRAIVRHATAAVEGDSVTAVRARWEAESRAPRSDRLARLGLGTLAHLSYDLDAADSLLSGLLPETGMAPDPISVRARLGLAQVARSRPAFAEAERMLVVAREEAERLGEAEAATEAIILLAMTSSRTAGPKTAEALFAEAEPRVADDPLLGALHDCGLADLLVLTSRPAAREAARGAELAERVGAGRLEAACLGARASDRAREGDMEGALADMHASAELRRALRDYVGLAVALQWRGFWLRSIGRLEQARAELDESVQAAHIAHADSPRAWAYANLAYIDLAVGDAPSGAAHADSAALLFAAQGDRYGEGTIAGVMGDVAFGGGDLEAARAAYTRTLEILEPLGFGVGIVTTHIALAHVSLAERAWDEAEHELELAGEVAEAGGMRGRLFGLAYHRGVLAMRRGRPGEAEAEFGPGLARVETEWGEDPAGGQPDWAYHYRMRLAEIRAARGDVDAAAALAGEAMDALEAWRATLSTPALRLLAFQVSEDRSDPDLGFASIVAAMVADGRVEQAFALSERLRARSIQDQVARIASLGGRQESEPGAGETAAPGATNPADVIASLPNEETGLLAWVTGRGGEPTTLFALDRAGVRARVLAPADSIEAAVRRLGAALASGDLPERLSLTVAEAVLGDASTLFPLGVRRLVVVPDGPLHMVPFDALLLEDGAPLLERFALTVQSSAGLAERGWRSSGAELEPSVLAVGDPQLTGTLDSDLPPLRGALREARRAARYGVGSTAMVGADASEALLKTVEPGRYGLIHFATHARLDEATLAGAVLLMAPGGGEDGIVRAGELARLHLDAGVALLSACSTASGRAVRGEGLVGLASALREAGVRTVVLTRWSVDDGAEAELVEELYRGLAQGLSVGDAVQGAKLEMRARGASPAVWANLTVVGDEGVTLLLRRPQPEAASVFAALALLVLGAAVVLRRRSITRVDGPVDGNRRGRLSWSRS